MSTGKPHPIGRLKPSDSHPRRLIFLTVRTERAASAAGSGEYAHRFSLARVSRWVWTGYDDSGPPARNELERVGPYSCRERRTLTDPDELVTWVERSTNAKLDSWLISHRLAAEMQVGGLLAAIQSGRWRFDSRIRETPDDIDTDTFAEPSPGLQVLQDPPTILSLRVLLTNRLIALDSRNYWNIPIAELGRSVGVTIPDEPPSDSMDRWTVPYLDARLRSIELPVLRLVEWLDRKEFGRLRFTAGGVAMQAYRTRHIPIDIQPTIDVEVRKAEREFSYAGEVRTWRIGTVDGPIYSLDVSSLYPSVMRDNVFPYTVVGKRIGGTWKVQFPQVDLETVAAEVFIRDYSDAWPCKTDGSTRFVRGTFTTWLAGPELAEAVAKGVVLGWRSAIVYRTANLFRDFVDDLWGERMAARNQGDKVRDAFAKLLLNSLFGKFGQRGGDLVQRTDFYAGVDWGRWTTKSAGSGKRRSFLVMAGIPWEEVPKKELRRSFPAISAWVTAWGRRRMRTLRRLAGGHNVVYQGVDALLVTEEGKNRLNQAGEVAENRLGKLREQGSAPSCTIRGWGDYELGPKRVVQGIKPDAVKLSDRRFEFPIFDTLRRMIFLPGSRILTESRRVVTLPPESVIGTVDADGIVSAPLRREPIPDDLRAGLQHVGRYVDIGRE